MPVSLSSLAHHPLVEGALDFLWPERCVGCDEPGTLLCEACAHELPVIDQRWACPVCGAPFGWLVCTQCRGAEEDLPRIVSAYGYEGAAARLVKVYKDEHELRLAPLLAEAIARALEAARREEPRHRELAAGDARRQSRAFPEELDALTFIPSTPEALARRGFDPMEQVAAHLSPLLGLPVADVLLHASSGDQRELGREERATNVAGTFEVMGEVFGSRLLVVDDVVTTGASLRAATRALVARGATVRLCASVVRAW